MTHLVRSRLALAGVELANAATCSGKFNRSDYLYEIPSASGVQAAMDCIRDAFGSVGVLGIAEIGWLDDREQILRIVHPAQKEMLFPHDELNAVADDTEQYLEALERITQLYLDGKLPKQGEQPE